MFSPRKRQQEQSGSSGTKEHVQKYVMPKLKCAFHNEQLLTNFCSAEECLLPLCPSCIKIHTNEHINNVYGKNGSNPVYQNLCDVLSSIHGELMDFRGQYQTNHRIFVEIEHKVNDYKEEMLNNLENIEQEVLSEVRNYFQSTKKKLKKQMQDVKYIKNLNTYKNQTKQALVVLSSLQKSWFSQNASGKNIIRNLIKFQSNKIRNHLQHFDHVSKQFMQQLDGNFCNLFVRQNLCSKLSDLLENSLKTEITEIQTDITVPTLSQQLMKIIPDSLKNKEKNYLQDSIKKILDKTQKTTAKENEKKSSTKKLNKTLSYELRDKQNVQVSFDKDKQQNALISRKVFGQNLPKEEKIKQFGNFTRQKRTFSNHKSERKSLKVSNSFCCEKDMGLDAMLEMFHQESQKQSYDSRTIKNFQIQKGKTYFLNKKFDRKQRRSQSKGKGLSICQTTLLNRSKEEIEEKYSSQTGPKNGSRFSLANIQNFNIQLDGSKSIHTPVYLQRHKR